MNITFHGAAGNVTGSKHLVEHADARILLDCGFFQGRRSEARERNSEFPFDPQSVHAAVLSHAHLDHCGLLPMLVKQGFRGSIYSTPPTRDIARNMMNDAAVIQEYDYLYLKKKRVRGHEQLAKPLYTREDIPRVMRRMKTHEYVRNGGKWLDIWPGARIKFYDAGHILGSAVTVLEMGKGRNLRRIAYTGDLGRRHSPLLHDPQYIKEKIDVLISESTYGGRTHRDMEAANEKIIRIVNRIVETKGKLVIPAFSLGRTQEIVYVLHHLTDSGRIPRIPIFVDSPLAGRLTTIFKKYRSDYDLQSKLDFPRPGDVPLAFRNLTYTKSRDESIALNSRKGPLAIISASGMAEGGRVLHHLKQTLRSKDNTVLFTGYQAVNTLGRRILEGQSPVYIYGRRYHVRAEIEKVNELSAHADAHELTEYIGHIKGLKKVFLVHGEEQQAGEVKALLATKLPNVDVHIPHQDERVEIL